MQKSFWASYSNDADVSVPDDNIFVVSFWRPGAFVLIRVSRVDVRGKGIGSVFICANVRSNARSSVYLYAPLVLSVGIQSNVRSAKSDDQVVPQPPTPNYPLLPVFVTFRLHLRQSDMSIVFSCMFGLQVFLFIPAGKTCGGNKQGVVVGFCLGCRFKLI